MKGNIIWKLVITALVVSWALINIIPPTDTPFEEYIATRATANQTEFAELLERAHTRVADGTEQSVFLALRNMGEEEQIDYYNLYFPDINLVDVRNLNRRNTILFDVLLKESQGKIKQGLDLKGGVAATLRIDDAAGGDFEREQQLEQAIEIMTSRVNGLGVAEPLIRAVPPNGIEIQMPGISTADNPDVLNAIQKPARLEFRLVHRTEKPIPGVENVPPPGYEILILERENAQGEIVEHPVYVRRIPEATGEIVQQAFPTMSPAGSWEVAFNMTSAGRDVWGEMTQRVYDEDQRTGVQQPLAIVLDGKLYSTPVVKEPMWGGRSSISGNFSQREVIELSNVLNNPLQFELRLDELYEIGPSLAHEARDASVYAALLGAGLVILFMIAYYLAAGLVAVISVLTTVFIVVGILASIGATLTLPGIAALVLTIGMAVDANILIFERIREELRAGKSLPNALSAGYEKAFSTIIDANVTTLITAAILIYFGSGPVKGFGVTLSIGIFSTVFCALIFSRALLEILVYGGLVKRMLPFGLLTNTHYDFFKYRRPAFAISWLIVLAGISALFMKGDKIYGIDFLGGSEIIVEFNQEHRENLSVQSIQQVAEDRDLGEVLPVFTKIIGGEDERLKIQVDSEEGRTQEVLVALQESFPEAELKMVGENVIGAAVSASIRWNAVLSILIALVGILFYVALRFEVGFGVGAVVATVHDLLMTIGIFVLVDGQFTAPMVAAILMVAGYSINDTIVIFDRIREELDFHPEKSLREVIIYSINQTLSRTLLTSVTTMFAALALWIFGAGVIKDFAFIFLVGIITGTFSSIFIASPVFYWWHKGDRRHVTERELTPKYEWEASSKRA